MVERKYFVIAATVTYFVLIILFFKFKESSRFKNICLYESVCIRFCCQSQATCNDKFIRDNLKVNISRYGEAEEFKDVENIKILYGKPTCKMTNVPEGWKFDYVSLLKRKLEFCNN